MSPNKLSFVIVIMLMTSTCASAAIYNPRMQVDSNWISTTLCSVMSTPTLYDVNGDGYKEIIVAAASYVYIFDHTGSVLPGWPQRSGLGTGASPVIGDIDGDGDVEIALSGEGTMNRYLYLRHHNGSNVAGWPIQPAVPSLSTMLFADIDDDSLPELIVGTEGYVYALNHDGSNVLGWPKSAGHVRAQPVSSDLDGDGIIEIVAASINGNVYAWNHDGSELWTKYVGEVYSSAPLVTNIDFDDEPEIIVATRSGDVYALNHDGTVVTGWPVRTGYRISRSSPSAADIDGDGDIEIVIGSENRKVLAFHHDGSIVSGWPISVKYSVTSQPNLYDIDGNGLPEIVVTCDDGYVYAWNGDGKLLNGWPQFTVVYRPLRGKPAIDDIDNDGVLELIVGSYANKLYSWDLNVLNTPPVAVIGSPGDGSVVTADISVNLISSSSDEDGYIDSYEWTSDKDGVIGNSQSSSVLLSSGEHNITLNVVDNDGLEAITSINLLVNSRPIALINVPGEDSVYLSGSPVSFESGSIDSDGTVISYQWVSDIDGVIGNTTSFSATDLSSGWHNVTFVVVDDNGASDSVSTRFKVNIPPTALIDTPVSDSVYLVGSSISFDSGSSDIDGTLTDIQWISDKDGVIGTNASFVASNLPSGWHNVTLTVVDDDGASDSASIWLKVNVPPTALIGTPVSDSIHLVGSSISFESGSIDSDGTITSYQWMSGIDDVIGNTTLFSVTDLSSGWYNVTLTVVDDNSASDSVSTRFKVNIPPVVSITSPASDMVFGQTDTAIFGCSASDEDGYIASYEWLSDIDGLIGSTDSFDISMLSTGVHRITLAVSDDDGTTATDAIVLNQTGYSVEWMGDAFDPGRTVPIKFRIIDPMTLENVIDTSVVLKISVPDGAEIFNASVGTGSDSIRYAEGTGQYICNFKLDTLADIGEYVIELDFDSIRPDQEFTIQESIGLFQRAKGMLMKSVETVKAVVKKLV